MNYIVDFLEDFSFFGFGCSYMWFFLWTFEVSSVKWLLFSWTY